MSDAILHAAEQNGAGWGFGLLQPRTPDAENQLLSRSFGFLPWHWLLFNRLGTAQLHELPSWWVKGGFLALPSNQKCSLKWFGQSLRTQGGSIGTQGSLDSGWFVRHSDYVYNFQRCKCLWCSAGYRIDPCSSSSSASEDCSAFHIAQ